MKSISFTLITLLICAVQSYSQNPLEKFNNLIGKWEGTGQGFSSTKSVIQTKFNWALNKQFVEG